MLGHLCCPCVPQDRRGCVSTFAHTQVQFPGQNASLAFRSLTPIARTVSSVYILTAFIHFFTR
jgi:hypothetical protein